MPMAKACISLEYDHYQVNRDHYYVVSNQLLKPLTLELLAYSVYRVLHHLAVPYLCTGSNDTKQNGQALMVKKGRKAFNNGQLISK